MTLQLYIKQVDGTWQAKGRQELGTYNYATFRYAAYGNYKPDSSTSGIPTGSPALTINSGNGTNLTITSGGTYDLINFKCRVIINTSARVIFTRCKFEGNATLSSNSGLVDCNGPVMSGKRNVFFYDCLFVPSTPSVWWDGVIGHDYTCHRCEVLQTVDGFGAYNTNSPTETNVSLYGCYVHDLSYFSPDPNHSSDVPVSATHNDCIQIQGGSNVLVQGCNFQGFGDPSLPSADGSATSDLLRDSSNPNSLGGYNARYPELQTTSCVVVTPNVSDVSNVTIDRSWFDGGAAVINVAPNGTYSTLNCTITNNRMGRNQATHSNKRILLPADTTTATLENNVFDDDGTPVDVTYV